jgi:hypothetical protein
MCVAVSFVGMTEKRLQGSIERLNDFECGLCVVLLLVCGILDERSAQRRNFLVNYCRYSLSLQ